MGVKFDKILGDLRETDSISDISGLQTGLDGKVNIDGTSVMTGSLYTPSGVEQGVYVGRSGLVNRTDGNLILCPNIDADGVFSVSPSGNNFSAFEFFSTDFCADQTNYNRLEFYTRYDGPIAIFSDSNGSYSNQDIIIGADTTGHSGFSRAFNQLYLSANGEVGIKRTPTNGGAGIQLGSNVETANDIEISDSSKGYILKSPDNTRWRITIDNTGALITTAI